MAAILIVEDDGLVARDLARTLRQAGHTPSLAPDARFALEEAAHQPDLILLDLGLPDLPGEELLKRLKGQPETAHIPILVLTGKREAAHELREFGGEGVADILLKPVSGAQLCGVVNTILTAQAMRDPDDLATLREWQDALIKRLIAEGPDALAIHVGRRLLSDRKKGREASPPETLTWTELADWGRQEGLLDGQQAQILRLRQWAGPQT